MFNYYQDENVAATSYHLRKVDFGHVILIVIGGGTSSFGCIFSSWLADCEPRTNMSRWRNVSNCHSKRPLYILTKM